MTKTIAQKPPHPGRYVKTEVLKPHCLSVTASAKALGVTRQALSSFLNEQTHLSPDMAIRLEKAFGVSMELLMQMQNSCDIDHARRRAKEIKVSPIQISSNQNEGYE